MTTDDIKQLRLLIREEVTPIVEKAVTGVEKKLTKKIETVELKVEINTTSINKLEQKLQKHIEENKKEHEKIMNYLIENSDRLENRIEKLEHNAGFTNKN